MIEVKRNHCSCHPETCCCAEYAAYEGEQKLFTGMTKEGVEAAIAAIQRPLADALREIAWSRPPGPAPASIERIERKAMDALAANGISAI